MKKSVVDWGSSKLFHFIHSNNLVYNTCWEDPALDRIALEINPRDNLMVITSAGCNVLDYALLGPNHIAAVDVNPRQNALLELKIAGIRALDFEDFFAVFGRGRHPEFERVYTAQMRPYLSDFAKKHWDKNLSYFLAKKASRSFYFRGTSGTVARWINYYIDALSIRSAFEAIMNANTLEEQKAIYDERVRGPLWNRIIRWVISTDASLSMVGVPRPQRHQVENGYNGGMAKFIEDCIEAVFTKIPFRNNYFWSLYLEGEYSKERCPEYLKQHNFMALKNGLVDSITIHTETIANFLNSSSEKFSKFVLLDHMDWLSTYQLPALREEWQAIYESACDNARAIWRSGGMQTDFVDAVPLVVGGKRQLVADRIKYDRPLADRLHSQDRVHTYGSFYIADLLV